MQITGTFPASRGGDVAVGTLSGMAIGWVAYGVAHVRGWVAGMDMWPAFAVVVASVVLLLWQAQRRLSP